jgi:hypothetical protein
VRYINLTYVAVLHNVVTQKKKTADQGTSYTNSIFSYPPLGNSNRANDIRSGMAYILLVSLQIRADTRERNAHQISFSHNLHAFSRRWRPINAPETDQIY